MYFCRDQLSGYEKQVDAVLLLKTRCHTTLPGLITHALILHTLYYIKYEEKYVISQSIGITVIKSKETRVVAYTYKYSSGSLIPNSATATD